MNKCNTPKYNNKEKNTDRINYINDNNNGYGTI